jgi:hypothetical protein
VFTLCSTRFNIQKIYVLHTQGIYVCLVCNSNTQRVLSCVELSDWSIKWNQCLLCVLQTECLHVIHYNLILVLKYSKKMKQGRPVLSWERMSKSDYKWNGETVDLIRRSHEPKFEGGRFGRQHTRTDCQLESDLDLAQVIEVYRSRARVYYACQTIVQTIRRLASIRFRSIGSSEIHVAFIWLFYGDLKCVWYSLPASHVIRHRMSWWV